MSGLDSVENRSLRQAQDLPNADLQCRDRRAFAGLSGAVLRAAATAGLTAVALPAMASREVESLMIVPKILGWFAKLIGQGLVLLAVISILLTPLIIWFVRRAGAASHFRTSHPTPPIVWLRESGESGSHLGDAVPDDLQRQAQMKAQAEAIELRPQVSATAAVDEDTRNRIAAAAKRLKVQ